MESILPPTFISCHNQFIKTQTLASSTSMHMSPKHWKLSHMNEKQNIKVKVLNVRFFFIRRE